MADFSAFESLATEAAIAPPCVAIILGSGMGSAASSFLARSQVSFEAVPGLAGTTVPGHSGILRLGSWSGKSVLVFEGRLHRYEGHDWQAVVAATSIAWQLGARILLLTNAAGGINENLVPGSLMAIRDHIEWTYPFCRRRRGLETTDAPRPSPYSGRLLEKLAIAAGNVGLELATGTYAAVTGPCYETPAEIRALRAWGADAVGMSTSREIDRGHELGMECAAISFITNRAAGLGNTEISHAEVLAAVAAQVEKIASLIGEFVSLL